MQVRNEGPSVNNSLSQFLQEQLRKLKWNRILTSNEAKQQETRETAKDEIGQLLDDECEKIISEISDLSLKESCICDYVTNKCRTASSEELMNLLKVHNFVRSTSKRKVRNDKSLTPEEFASNFATKVMEKIQYNKACRVKPNNVSKKILTNIETPSKFLNKTPSKFLNKSTNEPSTPQRFEGERDEVYPFYPCPRKNCDFQVYQSYVDQRSGNKKCISIQTEDRCAKPQTCDCCSKKDKKKLCVPKNYKELLKDKTLKELNFPECKNTNCTCSPPKKCQCDNNSTSDECPIFKKKRFCVPKNFKQLLKDKTWEELNFPECKNPNCTCSTSVYRRKEEFEDCAPPPPPPCKMEDKCCEAKPDSTENICIQTSNTKNKKGKTGEEDKSKKKKGTKSKKSGNSGGCFPCNKKKKNEEVVDTDTECNTECEYPEQFEKCVQMPEKKQAKKCIQVESTATECDQTCDSPSEVCTKVIVCNKCGRLVKKKQKKVCPGQVKHCPTASTIIISSAPRGQAGAADLSALKSTIKAEAKRNYDQMEKILQELRLQRQDLQKLNQMYEKIINSLMKDGQITDIFNERKSLQGATKSGQSNPKSSICRCSPDIGFCNISELYKNSLNPLVKPLCFNDPNTDQWKLFEYGDKQLKNLINKSKLILNCNVKPEKSQELNEPSDEDQTTTSRPPSDEESILTLFNDNHGVSNEQNNPKTLKSVCTLPNICGIPEDEKLQSGLLENNKTSKQESPNPIKTECEQNCNLIEVVDPVEMADKGTKSHIEIAVAQPLMVWIKQSINFLKKKSSDCSDTVSKMFKSKVHVCAQRTRYKLRRYMEQRMMDNIKNAP